MSDETQAKLNSAVLYALRHGCFFPVPEPRPGATVEELIKWGAMRNLHNAIREFWPSETPPAAAGRRAKR